MSFKNSWKFFAKNMKRNFMLITAIIIGIAVQFLTLSMTDSIYDEITKQLVSSTYDIEITKTKENPRTGIPLELDFFDELLENNQEIETISHFSRRLCRIEDREGQPDISVFMIHSHDLIERFLVGTKLEGARLIKKNDIMINKVLADGEKYKVDDAITIKNPMKENN